MTPSFSEDLSAFPPEQTVFPIAGTNLRVLDGDHPLLTANRASIRENWEREIAVNPALFDGRMVLQHRLRLSEDGIASEAHTVPFSTFMWWRRQPERKGAIHLFAYPVLESSDGALVAIRMGEHTANPGQVYFAAGSLEPEDVVDGRCDIDSNMAREVMEETGLDLADAVAGEGLHASHIRRSVSIFKLFRFDMTADEMVDFIGRHMLVAEDKEISGAVAIRTADPKAQPYNAAMLPIIDWYFAGK